MHIEFWVAAVRGEEQKKASSLGQPKRVDINRGFIHSNNYLLTITLFIYLYLSVNTRAVIGQFSRPYSTVRPAKFKSLF